jgi:hypothetical protein
VIGWRRLPERQFDIIKKGDEIMDAISVLRAEAQWAHQVFDGTTADVMDDAAHWGPQGMASTVASAMAHAVHAEDNIVQGMLQGKAPLAMSSFAGKTGISNPQMFNTPEWIRSVRLDLPAFREYTKAVFAATDEYIASLQESDLDRTVDLSQAGLGTQTVAWMLGALVIGHLQNYSGEISAIKGTQGLKGYPF